MPYGIHFNPREIASNSRLALEAAEFARDAGKFEEADYRLFRAYFQDGLNIGDKDIVLQVLGEIGLDECALSTALDNHAYTTRLQQAREKAQEHKIIALPTFIINDTEKLVGAQPYDAFTRCLNVFV